MSKTLEARPPGRDLNKQDEHEWIAALADGRLHRLDRANLAEYLTEMTIRDRRELRSRLAVLLHYLLRIRVQPQQLRRSWATTSLEQQNEIGSLIDSIPGLRRQAEILSAAPYPDALRRAARETGLPAERFPASSPWTVPEPLAFDPPEPTGKGKRHP